MIIQNNPYFEVPPGFVIFISGVPGSGKTTISYELLKKFDVFRIVEETDLIREALRGYNEYIKDEFKDRIQFLFDEIEISDHTKLLTMDEARQQCKFMKNSLENIVLRQQRKGIPSIVNGVHVIPEILDGIFENRNIIYVNLYVNSEKKIYDRLFNRNPNSYMLNHTPLIFQTNVDLYFSTLKKSNESNYVFNNIDVTDLSIEETMLEVVNCIAKRTLHEL